MTVCTFGSPLSDIELWRCARQQLDQHGGPMEAVIAANRRIDDLTGKGDADGVNTWMAITLRILHLSAGESGPDLH